MRPSTLPALTTSFKDRKAYGIPYGPMTPKDAKAFAKTGGKSGALLVAVKGEGTYVGFLPEAEFAAAWLGVEGVKSVTVLTGKA